MPKSEVAVRPVGRPTTYRQDRQGPLENARVRAGLIRELATGERPIVELAAEHGVSHVAVVHFRKRHRTEIAHVRANLEDDLAAYWIARKAERIGAHQQDVETIEALVTPAARRGDRQGVATLIRAKTGVLNAVAAELGALTANINTNVAIRVELVGVDTGALT